MRDGMSTADERAPATPSGWRAVAGAVVLWRLFTFGAGVLLGPRLTLLSPSARLVAWSAIDALLLLAAAAYGRRASRIPLDFKAEFSADSGRLVASSGLGVALAALNLLVNLAAAKLKGGEGLALSGASAGLVDASSSWTYFWLSAGALILVAPPTEEAFYRGFVQRSLGAGRGTALAASSLLFWNFHTHGGWTPAPLILGLALGVLHARTGSLAAVVACHAANNATAVLLALAVRLR